MARLAVVPKPGLLALPLILSNVHGGGTKTSAAP